LGLGRRTPKNCSKLFCEESVSKEKRKQIANIYWDLKKDFHKMELQDIYYDVGLMVGHCLCINKPKLSERIYSEFMEGK